MKKKTKVILIVLLLMFVAQKGYTVDLKAKMVDRVEVVNDRTVRYSYRLEYPRDKLSNYEIEKRVDFLWHYVDKYSTELDYNKNKIAITIFSIMEHETGFVNWRSLDGGKSFGVGSMRWSTAKMIARQLGEEFEPYKLEYSEKKQIKYTVYHFIDLLKRYDSLDKAILSYNLGSYDQDEFYHNYYFTVRGRVNHLTERWLSGN